MTKIKPSHPAPEMPDKDTKAIVHMRCFDEDKLRWKQAARAESLKLAPWIIRTLDAEIKRSRRRKPETP